jgi:hypothetical protein
MSKILRKLALQLQTGATYESNAMKLIPFTDGVINQSYDDIKDDGISGVGFENTPQQGPRHVGGNYPFNVDAVSIIPILSQALGSISNSTYFFNGSHTLKLSVAELNDIGSVLYTSAYIKSLKLSGAKGGFIKGSMDLFSTFAQNRGVVGSFPSAAAYGIPFTFHEAGGTNGYFRIGDQGNALDSGDDVLIESFDIDIATGFDESYANENDASTPDAIGSLTPKWGMVPPSVKFNFKIPRYLVNTLLDFQDASTLLQAELRIYKSATAIILVKFTNLKIKVDLTSDDLTAINVECTLGRNGIGTSYINANMAYNSPIHFTVTNS